MPAKDALAKVNASIAKLKTNKSVKLYIEAANLQRRLKKKAAPTKEVADDFAQLRALSLTNIKKLPTSKYKSLYKAFLEWFERDESDDPMPKNAKEMNTLIWSGDPITEGGVLDFLIDQKLLPESMDDD